MICPFHGCKGYEEGKQFTEISPYMLKEWLSADTYEKYEKFRMLDFQCENPAEKMVFCPDPKCDSGQMILKGDPTYRCIECRHERCSQCNNDAHWAFSCLQVL
jgi:hypothetical protein